MLAPPAEDYFDPYLKQHYDTCDCSPCKPSFDISRDTIHYQRDIKACDACAVSEVDVAGGLKRCTQCRCAGYCCKQCQLLHWKQHHKLVRKQMAVAASEASKSATQAYHVKRELRFGHQSIIRRQAAYRSGISNNVALVSPYLGITSQI